VTSLDPERAGILASYLGQLNAALAALTPDERQEILLETRSHVLDRWQREPSRRMERVLAELGPAREYARQFLPDAVEPPPPPGPPALARLVTGGVRTLPLLFVVVGAYSVAMLLLLAAVTELVDPTATGLYVGGGPRGRGFQLVLSDPAPSGRDVLGPWFAPAALALAVAIHLLLVRLLRRVLRTAPPAAPDV
jgi:hypothetical protein